MKEITISEAVILILILFWALLFIYRSSFVAIDGKRYFCLNDDAMISMTYAKNLVSGRGLTWNGAAVEGYTNLSWVFVMSMVIYIFGHIHAPLIIQLLGILLLAANAFIIMKIMLVIYDDMEEYKTYFFIASLSYFPLLYWSLEGMETGLLALLLSLSVYFTILDKQEVDCRLLISLFLLFATRPDMGLMILILLVYRAFHLREKQKRIIFFESLFLLFPICLLMLFKFEYYGSLLPNTFYLKVTTIPLQDKIRNGIGYLIPFVASLSFLGFVQTPLKNIMKSPAKSLILILLAASAIYQIYIGGDSGPLLYRLITPIFVIFLVLVAMELFIANNDNLSKFVMPLLFIALFNLTYTKQILFIPYRLKIFTIYFLLLFLILVAVLILLISRNQWLKILIPVSFITLLNISFVKDTLFLTSFSRDGNLKNVNRSLIINAITSDKASIAVFWAGTMPYLTGKKSYDFLGKNDEYIARLEPKKSPYSAKFMCYLPGHNKYDLKYTLSYDPTVVEDLVYEDDDFSYLRENYYEVRYQGVKLFYIKKNDVNVKLNKIRDMIVDKNTIEIDDYNKLTSL